MATYYVDATGGSDSANGTSDSTPWKTIAKVNAATFSAGDSILFKKGETWREQLTVPSSGSAGNPITFGAYGSGEKPVITGANLVTPGTSWSHTEDATEETGGLMASGLEDETNDFTTDFTGYSVSGDNTITVSTDVANHGTKAIKITYAGSVRGAYAYKTLSPAPTTVYVRAFVRFASGFRLNANYRQLALITINDDAPNINAMFYVRTAGASTSIADCMWYIRENVSGTDVYLGEAGQIEADTWYRIEIKYVIHASTGGVQAWVDGVSLGSKMDVNTSSRANDFITIGANSAGSDAPVASSVYYDDIKIDTSAIGDYSAGAGDPENVWNATVTTEPLAVAFNGVRGTKVASKAACDGARKWYWASNVLSVYSTSDPDTAYTSPGIEPYARQYAAKAVGKSYLTFDNLNLVGGQPVAEVTDVRNYGAGLSLEVSAADAIYQGYTVQNCTFTHSGGVGLLAWMEWTGSPGGRTAQNITIIENTFNEANWELSTTHNANLIYLYSRPGDVHWESVTITDNYLYQDITINPTNDSGYFTGGMWLDVTGGDILVSQNEITGVSHGITVYGESNTSDLGIYSRNYIHDTSDDCFWFAGTFASAIVSYNICYNSLDQFIDTYRSDAAADQQSGLEIYNNTVHTTANAGINLCKIENVLIKNNIFYNIGTSNALSQQYHYLYINDTVNGSTNTTIGTLETDYNIIYISAGAKVGVFNSAESTNYTLANWISGKNQDTHSITDDPLFVNAVAGNFSLQAGSPAINAGTDVSLTTDYAGNTVPKGALPDIGAYEWFVPIISSDMQVLDDMRN
jgi:hypothetical protein